MLHDIGLNVRPVSGFVSNLFAVAANRQPARERLNTGQHFLESLEQPLSLLLRPISLDTHLDGYSQVRGAVGFENVTIRFGKLSTLEHWTVTVAAYINQRHAKLTDLFGGLDPIHLPCQLDVHQHQVRPQPLGQGDCLLSAMCNPRHFVTKALKPALEFLSHSSVIFGNEDLLLAEPADLEIIEFVL